MSHWYDQQLFDRPLSFIPYYIVMCTYINVCWDWASSLGTCNSFYPSTIISYLWWQALRKQHSMVSHAAKLSLLAEFLKVCCLHPSARITSFHLFFFHRGRVTPSTCLSVRKEWEHNVGKVFPACLEIGVGQLDKTVNHWSLTVNNSKQAKHSWEITWDNKIAEARSRYPSQKNEHQCEDEFLLPIWCLSFYKYNSNFLDDSYTNPPISQGFIVEQFLPLVSRKLRELQQNVIQREHIRRLRGPASGGQQKTGGGGRVEDGGGQTAIARDRNLPLPRSPGRWGCGQSCSGGFQGGPKWVKNR